jgi:hypothetical protein
MSANELYDNAIQALDELYEMLDKRATKIDEDNSHLDTQHNCVLLTPAGALWKKAITQRGKIGQMHYWVSKMKKKEMKDNERPSR